MSEHVDVAVVGLGAMGSAALYQLAKRGADVVGLDRYAPPHTQGSTHGETRITREAVGEGAACVPFVMRSHQIWRELEAATGEHLFEACGALILAPRGIKAWHHGQADFVSRSIQSAQAFGIAHEVLDAGQIAGRFPQFTGLSGKEWAYFEPGGGYVRPEACVAAQLRRASELGARIGDNTEVLSLEQTGQGVRIATTQGTLHAGQVIVSAGGWCGHLLGAPFDRLLTVTRQVLHWYEVDDLGPYQQAAPVFIWMHGERDTDYFYGFPPLPGEPRIKVASEQYVRATTPFDVDRNVAEAESAGMYCTHVQGRLAGVGGQVAASATCFYTTTPDHGFLIDRHPGMDRVLVVSACSGHGFKHSAGIGEAVAQYAAGQSVEMDLSPFSLARFG